MSDCTAVCSLTLRTLLLTYCPIDLLTYVAMAISLPFIFQLWLKNADMSSLCMRLLQMLFGNSWYSFLTDLDTHLAHHAQSDGMSHSLSLVGYWSAAV